MATTDLLTLVEARSAINLPVGDAEHDVVLGQYVTAITAALDARCGPIVVRNAPLALRYELGAVSGDPGSGELSFDDSDPSAAIGLKVSNTDADGLDVSGLLGLAAVGEVAWLVDDRGQAYAYTIDGVGDVALDARPYVITYVSGPVDFAAEGSPAMLTIPGAGSAHGRFANTELVEDHFKTAAAIALRGQWSPNQGQRSPVYDVPPLEPFTIPRQALGLLSGELRPGIA